ncbi:MAG: Biosynthetic peptidoglycan transglycosylase [Bacteroidetes bacterium]|nr:Biosynthetic peptidoglycan transglycosylase [Bacteroidota bacterium]
MSRAQRLLTWVKNHKLKTLFIALGLFLLYELFTIPYFSIAELRTESPMETALMRQRISEAARDGKTLKIIHRWVPLSRISKNVVDAVIVAEDGTFYSHGGVDWFEVRESIEKNIDERRAARGASTITQQLAKNLYLSTSKDPVRKLKELIITLLLENKLGKSRILEIYLNVIEWGRGVFGVEAAAQTYFGKPASALSLEEATRLAAVIPSPLRHRPDEDSRYVQRRKLIVLRRMQARDFANQEQLEENPSKTNTDTLSITPEDTTEVDSTDIEEEGSNGP